MAIVRRVDRSPATENTAAAQLGVGDTATFWETALHWNVGVLVVLVTAKALIPLALIVGQGTDVTLEWRYGLPSFVLDLDQSQLNPIVTWSNWLGIGAMIACLLAAEARHTALPTAQTELDTAPPGYPMYLEFVTHARRAGVRLGALIGAAAMPLTLLAELIWHRFSTSQIISQPHLVSLVIATIPIFAFVTIWRRGEYRPFVDRAAFAPAITFTADGQIHVLPTTTSTTSNYSHQ